MELDGIVQDGVIVPEGDCPLPEGTKVRIQAVTPPSGDRPAIWEKLSALGRKAELRSTNLPTDLAENHDRYLHGQAKRL